MLELQFRSKFLIKGSVKNVAYKGDACSVWPWRVQQRSCVGAQVLHTTHRDRRHPEKKAILSLLERFAATGSAQFTKRSRRGKTASEEQRLLIFATLVVQRM